MKLTSAIRNLKKNPLASIINITGLTIGLLAGFLLLTFVRHELSYDKHFQDWDRIYRLVSGGVMGNSDNVFIGGRCMREAFTEIPAKVPGIEIAAQVYPYGSPAVFYNNQRYATGQRLYVDSTFFRIFALKTLQGDVEKALQNRDQLVITKALAKTIFKNESAVGQNIVVGEEPFLVGAVVEDIPENSHIQASLFHPMKSLPFLRNLGALEFYTYYKLFPDADREASLTSINTLNTSIISRKFASFGATGVSDIEPLKDLHLKTQVTNDLTSRGSMKSVLFLALVCVLILLMAGSNYVSLSVLQGENRAREVGVRKINGAAQKTLRWQFLKESATLAGLSLFLAIVVGRYLLLEPFENLMNREFNLTFSGMGVTILIMVAIGLLTAFLSGFYPALVLSSIKPLNTLKGSMENRFRKTKLSRVMVTIQFTISVVLIGIVLLFLKQVHYLKNTSLGFDKENSAVVYGFDNGVRESYSAVREELLKHPLILEVGGSQSYPGGGKSGQVIHKYGEDASTQSVELAEERVMPGYFKAFGIPLAEGRYFEAGRESDRNAIILNETAVKKLGYKGSAVGERVVLFEDPMEIIGVVKDFHYSSMRSSIGALGFTWYSNYWSSLSIRCRPEGRQEVLAHVEKTLQEYDADYALKVRWIDDLYDSMYRDEVRMNMLLVSGSILAVLISALGLFALAGYVVKKRNKEIGIRKVMGCSPEGIRRMIQTNVLGWLSVSILIAAPLVLIIGNRWLQSFAYHTKLSWWILPLAACIAGLIALFTSGYFSMKAANSDPVKVLRQE